jgi:hypothetical protein
MHSCCCIVDLSAGSAAILSQSFLLLFMTGCPLTTSSRRWEKKWWHDPGTAGHVSEFGVKAVAHDARLHLPVSVTRVSHRRCSNLTIPCPHIPLSVCLSQESLFAREFRSRIRKRRKEHGTGKIRSTRESFEEEGRKGPETGND